MDAGSAGVLAGSPLVAPPICLEPFKRRISIQASHSSYSNPKAFRWHFETCFAAHQAPKNVPPIGEQILIGLSCLAAPKTAGSYRKPAG